MTVVAAMLSLMLRALYVQSLNTHTGVSRLLTGTVSDVNLHLGEFN